MPDTFPIEKSVKMPVITRGAVTKYPFAAMAVGDSFAVTVSDKAARQAAYQWRVTHDKSRRFSVQKTPDGYRCWRVA